MKNYVQEGNVISAVAAAAVAAGQVVAIGVHLGVANAAAAIGESFDATLSGVFTVPKSAGTAFTVGQSLMWDVSAKAFAPAAAPATGDVTGVATAFVAAAAGDTAAQVRFSGAPGVVAA